MAMALRPWESPSSIASRYGKQALAEGLRSGRCSSGAASFASESVITSMAGFGVESVITSLAGFGRSPTNDRTTSWFHKATGKRLKRGDLVKTFRGETATVLGWTEPRTPESTDRVTLRFGDDEPQQFYPAVIDAEWRRPKPAR